MGNLPNSLKTVLCQEVVSLKVEALYEKPVQWPYLFQDTAFYHIWGA